MKKLTALTLSAAMVPALALGTVAFADQGSEGIQADEQGTEGQDMERADEHDDELRADEDWDDEQQTGEDWDDEQRTGEDWDDEQRAGEQDDELRAGEQGAGEQFLSRKPEGALSSEDVIGKSVKLRDSDEEVGTIEDIVIGDDGRVLGAVITTGDFLGLGGRDVSMGWDQLEHSMEDDDSVFYTDMDEETLENAPEYERE